MVSRRPIRVYGYVNHRGDVRMAYDHIVFDEAAGVATLTLNRPAALNALTTPLLEEMIDAVDRVRDAGTARCLLLTGAGRAFCSGAISRAATSAAAAACPIPGIASKRTSTRCSSDCSRCPSRSSPRSTARRRVPAARSRSPGTSSSRAGRRISSRRSSTSGWSRMSVRRGCCRGSRGGRARRR